MISSAPASFFKFFFVYFSVIVVRLSYCFLPFLAVLGLCCCMGFSLVASSRSYSLVVVCGLLIAVASLVAEHRLYDERASVVAAPGLQSTGLAVMLHGLSCLAAWGLFPDQGLHLCLLHW